LDGEILFLGETVPALPDYLSDELTKVQHTLDTSMRSTYRWPRVKTPLLENRTRYGCNFDKQYAATGIGMVTILGPRVA
jgi:hypothetical protein